MGYHLEVQEVKKPEQLPLDFSDKPAPQSGNGEHSAVVYRFDQFREAAARSALAAVYDAIHDSAKHVNLRRRSTPSDAEDGSHYY
jgi:hypothetical protein